MVSLAFESECVSQTHSQLLSTVTIRDLRFLPQRWINCIQENILNRVTLAFGIAVPDV